MRHPATHARADFNHAPIAQAIELLGYEVMDLHAAGNGVEDLLVACHRVVARYVHTGDRYQVLERFWLVVEIKRPKNKRGQATPSQFTEAQKRRHAKTEGWPRIVATSAQDAVRQIRAMTDSPTQSDLFGSSSQIPSSTASGLPR